MIEESKDLTTLEFDHHVGSFISQEKRLKDIFSEHFEQVFTSKVKVS